MTNKAEQERKELNKKLLKTTFKSEMKKKKRINVKELLVDFIVGLWEK